ncbi:hypothetical protein NDU88_007701 [Pleurodeles waltl]|uniref:Uncharacterized protein n=1 Tax=Pleurodeles waltl TaxID=8319 RepID=A0AAV7PMN4_PLEWA|nr:hypothetical protein NDU88_007701 [Pleurodeles waltl]
MYCIAKSRSLSSQQDKVARGVLELAKEGKKKRRLSGSICEKKKNSLPTQKTGAGVPRKGYVYVDATKGHHKDLSK